jgi:hypothetical protein
MSQSMSPSIGRKVWYHPSIATVAVHGMHVNDPDVPMDASICYVWHDRMINISVADHAGKLHAITSVTLIAPGEPEPEDRDYCKWMPYQVKQASKDGEVTATVVTTGEPAAPASAALPPAVPTVTSLEQAIREAGADQAPRVTMQDIEANIISQHFFTAADGDCKAMENAAFVNGALDGEQLRLIPTALQLLTICVLVLRNGFTVVGTSAVASPENFNPEIGRRLARERAIDQIWPLMGYELRGQLHQAERLKQAA